jgi:hypothetical protein
MKQVRITWDEIAVGDDVTLWFKPRGAHGQGGIVQTIAGTRIVLVSGTAQHVNEHGLDEVHHVDKEVPFDADECIEYQPGICGGDVDLFAPGNGNAFPRCRVHRERRAKSYETSMERYADSDVEADWFDPANAGEHWGYDY